MRFHSMHEAFAAVLPFSYYNTGSGSPVSGVHRDPTRWHQGVRCTLHVVLKVWGGRKRRAINNHINSFYCQRDLLCKIKATVLRRLWPWKTIHCWRGLTKGDKRVSETPHLCFKVSKNSVMSPLWPRRAGRGYSGIGVGGGGARWTWLPASPVMAPSLQPTEHSASNYIAAKRHAAREESLNRARTGPTYTRLSSRGGGDIFWTVFHLPALKRKETRVSFGSLVRLASFFGATRSSGSVWTIAAKR